uniref:BED-type domain-containing protein n=1 Tax=Cyprinodon variegatus TaxID=28743 RepID=A0A3Q2D1X7_CYPVA
MEGEKSAFSSWKYRHYFEFILVKDDNIKVCCTLCAGDRVWSTFKNTTLNLKKHLEKHNDTRLPHGTSTETNLKAALHEVDFVSTTADIWTANNKSYIRVTLHWLSKDMLEHKKAALACRIVRGRHKYDVIGQEIEDIHSAYGKKVVATVKDNGSNFDDEMEEEPNPDDDVTFLPELLSAEHESDAEAKVVLPPHHSCSSHTINLISTNNVEKYLTSNADSKVVYRSSTAKCSALWTKASRSTSASVAEVSRRKLLVPTSTRWNSFFDAVKRVTEIPMNEEYQFLNEYCSATKPLTVTLDILQADCPYGTLLPTLEVLMQRTLAVKDALSTMTAGLPDTWFGDLLQDRDALLAAVSCPKFKLRWLTDANRREQVKQLLTEEWSATAPPIQSSASVANTPVIQGEMDFFHFEAEPEETYSAEKEIMNYPRSSHDLQILHQFTNIKKTFMWSVSSVWGVWYPGQEEIDSNQRFEKLLLMRYNQWFTCPTPQFLA